MVSKTTSQTVQVDIWSDIACPWCYVGKRRFEAALADFEHRDAIRLRWRAFELDPSAPQVLPADPPYVERLAKKYQTSTADAQQMIDTMTASAADDGLAFRFDIVRPGNTFDAHRLLHLAAEHELGDAAKERFLRAYLCEGESIGDRKVLERLAIEVGLDAAQVRATLAGDAHAAAVRADEHEAAMLGIRGVPFFVFDGRLGVSGAQPASVLREVLEQVWAKGVAKAGEGAAPVVDEAAGCGPEGCAIGE